MTNFLTSVLANIITICLVVLTVYLLGWLRGRRMLLRFFTGQSTLLPGRNKFAIYLSSLECRPSPGGFASIWELTEAWKLKELFVSLLPGPSGNPGLFRDFMVSGLDCEIIPVREGEQLDILVSNCLVVGSPMFNDAAQQYQQRLNSPVRFDPSNSADRRSAYRLFLPHEKPNEDDKRGVIARMRRDGKSYFYVAGRTEYSTVAALYVLRSKWYGLYKQFGSEKSFVVQVQAGSDDYRLSSEISRSELL